jgi:hypothetical protein
MRRAGVRNQTPRPDTHKMSRFATSALVAVVTLGVVTATAVVAPTPTLAGSPDYRFCPAAKHLLKPSTHFRRHTLGPGVRLAEAHLGHRHHRLELSVVRVNLHNRHSVIAPLHHAITTRHRLSQLARRPHLLAATNGTYFNFAFGAPTVPFISRHAPVVLSRQHERVAGISVHRRAQDGFVWLVGRVSGGAADQRIGALNDVTPPPGLSVYTPTWGGRKVPLPLLAHSLVVHHGGVPGQVGVHRRVPPKGMLLVGSTADAIAALYQLSRSGEADIRYHVNTDAPHTFQQAYGVGTQVVAAAHHVRSGLYCSIDEVYAARTDFAWRDHGHQLILATIESPHGSERYGVDENQMSQIMVGLGAGRSFALDGGGSTELVARLPGNHKLTIRTPRRKGHERPIPLGVGVYSLPVPVAPRHHRHHKHRHHAPHHHKKCLIGPLLCH